MKHNWEYKKLGEVGTVITGNTPSTKDKEYYSSNDFMFVKPGDIPEGRVSNIFETETYISEKAFSSVCRQLPKDAVLTTCIGNIGKVGILTKGATCNQQINAIIPSKLIVPKYLAYSILSIKELLNSKKNGPVVPIINKTQFSSFYIPVPPIETQERIVNELDEINEMIEGRKEQIKLLDQLAQSLFYEMFGDPISNPKGWEIKEIVEIFNTITDFVAAGSFASLRENVIYKENQDFAQLVRTVDLKSRFTKGSFVYVNKHAFDFLWRVNLNEECIILPNIGVNCGEVYYVKPNDLIYANNVLGPNAILIKSKKDIYLYLLYALKSPYFQDQLKLITNQVAQPKFNKTNLKSLKLPVPSISLQNEFASKIEMIEEQKKDIENSIKELETLLASRMDYWFN